MSLSTVNVDYFLPRGKLPDSERLLRAVTGAVVAESLIHFVRRVRRKKGIDNESQFSDTTL